MGVKTIITAKSIVICDKCGDTFEAENTRTMSEVREALYGSGWLIFSRKSVLCPRCLKGKQPSGCETCVVG